MVFPHDDLHDTAYNSSEYVEDTTPEDTNADEDEGLSGSRDPPAELNPDFLQHQGRNIASCSPWALFRRLNIICPRFSENELRAMGLQGTLPVSSVLCAIVN
jgi:hypothetical protein